MSLVTGSNFSVLPTLDADILQVPDTEVHLYFGGLQRSRWKVDGPTVAREIVTNPRWLERFAAVTFTRVLDEWLMTALRFPRPFPDGSGLEISIVNSSGVDLCSLGPNKGGEFFLRPAQKSFRNIASGAVERLIRNRVVRVNLSLTRDDDDSFGSNLRRAIEGNVRWSEARFCRASKAISSEALSAWVDEKRGSEDPDAYAMALALLENVRDLLFAWPRSFTKAEMILWRNFVSEVMDQEADPELMILFCALPVIVHGARVTTAALDVLGPRPEPHVNKMMAAVIEAQTQLRKPLFSAGELLKILPERFDTDGTKIRGVACAPESVIDVLSGKKKHATQFYLDEADRENVLTHLEKNGIETKKLIPRYFSVMGIVSRVELWIVERRVRLSFVESTVMTQFNESLVLNGSTFSCQKRGIVAIYGIGKIMWLVQKNKTKEAKHMRESLAMFHKTSHNGTALGFPLVNGKKRNKRKLYFSDWDKTLTYKADKSMGIPCALHAMDFTAHMRDEVGLDIEWN